MASFSWVKQKKNSGHWEPKIQCFLEWSWSVLNVLNDRMQDGSRQISFSTSPWTIRKWSTIFSYSKQSIRQIGQTDFPLYLSMWLRMCVRKASSSVSNFWKQKQQLFSIGFGSFCSNWGSVLKARPTLAGCRGKVIVTSSSSGVFSPWWVFEVAEPVVGVGDVGQL